MEILVLANKTWYEKLSKLEQDKLKVENPDIENSLWFKGDIVEVHEDGYYESRMNGYGKDDFIIVYNNGSVKDISLMQSVYEDTTEFSTVRNEYKQKIKNIRQYNMDIDNLFIDISADGKKTITESDISKLKIKDKKTNIGVTIGKQNS